MRAVIACRSYDLAADLVRFLRRITAEVAPDPTAESVFDDDVVGLLDAAVLLASPAWERLGVLVHRSGVQGWTNVRVDDPDAT
jgi:hypothetical protein